MKSNDRKDQAWVSPLVQEGTGHNYISVTKGYDPTLPKKGEAKTKGVVDRRKGGWGGGKGDEVGGRWAVKGGNDPGVLNSTKKNQ